MVTHLNSFLNLNSWGINRTVVLLCYKNKYYSIQISGPGAQVFNRGSVAG